MQRSFKSRLEALEALEQPEDAHRDTILRDFPDVAAWLDGSSCACPVGRVGALIRLPLIGYYNTWSRDVSYAETLYTIALSCVARRARCSVDDVDAVEEAIEGDPICAVWEHNAALCVACAEQGEPLTFRGEVGSLLGLLMPLPVEPSPARPQGVRMGDGRFIPLGGEHGELRGGLGEALYLLMPDGERRAWPPI